MAKASRQRVNFDPNTLTDDVPEHLQGLTERQAKFAVQYAILNNGTQSAIRAGYSPKSADTEATRLLKNEAVKGAIAVERITRSGSSWGDAEVLETLRKEATRTGEGSSHAARVAAARAYGEALGLFKRPDLDALASLQRIEIVLRLPDGSTPSVAGAALLRSRHAADDVS
jgi:hypothetical protein